MRKFIPLQSAALTVCTFCWPLSQPEARHPTTFLFKNENKKTTIKSDHDDVCRVLLNALADHLFEARLLYWWLSQKAVGYTFDIQDISRTGIRQIEKISPVPWIFVPKWENWCVFLMRKKDNQLILAASSLLELYICQGCGNKIKSTRKKT